MARLGGMTVREFLDRVDSDELTEWVAFTERIEDPARDPDWQRTAQICTVLDQLGQVWGKKARPYEKFLPQSTRRRAGPITPAAIQSRLAAFRSPAAPAARV